MLSSLLMKVQTVKPMLLCSFLGPFPNNTIQQPTLSGSLRHSSEWNWNSKIALGWLWIELCLKLLLLLLMSLSQGCAFAKMRSGPAALILQPKSRPQSLVPQLCPWGSFSLLKFGVFDHCLKARYYWLFTLLSDTLLLLCLIKRQNSDKENLSLTVAATWQDNLLKSELFESRIVWSIRHQVTSLTVCVPPVNWLISLDSVNWLVVVAL